MRRATLFLLLAGCGLGVGGAVEGSAEGSKAYPTVSIHISDAGRNWYGSFFARNVSRLPLMVGLDFYWAPFNTLRSPIPSIHPGFGVGLMARHTNDTTYFEGLGGFLALELLPLKRFNPKKEGFGRFVALYLRAYLLGHAPPAAAALGAEVGFRMSVEPSL